MVFIKAVTDNPKIVAGDYSYYDDPDDPEGFERNVLYAYGPEKLIIGKFCAIATGVKFIMSGANHKLDAVSIFPFPFPLPHFRRRLGRTDGPGDEPAEPGRHRDRQRCLDRL